MSTTAVPGARGTDDDRHLPRALVISPPTRAIPTTPDSDVTVARSQPTRAIPAQRAHGRQLGHAGPLKELVITLLAIVATLTAVGFLLPPMVTNLIGYVRDGNWLAVVSAVVFDVCVLGLVVSNLVYQANRWGVHRRRLEPAGVHATNESRLNALYSPGAEPGLVTILVPSYKEIWPSCGRRC